MSLSLMRVGGKLHWFFDSKRELYGLSYPVFYRGSFRFLIAVFVPRLRRRYFSPPSLSDLAHTKILQDWYDPLPSDLKKPLHDILES